MHSRISAENILLQCGDVSSIRVISEIRGRLFAAGHSR
jgi:hypothetical protein